MSDAADEYYAEVMKQIAQANGPTTEEWKAGVRAWLGRLPDLTLSEMQIWVDEELMRREVARALAERGESKDE